MNAGKNQLSNAFYDANGNMTSGAWSQNASGHPYISAKTSVMDEGTGNRQSALSTQAQDGYGNSTQTVVYPFNNTSTPVNTFDNTPKQIYQ